METMTETTGPAAPIARCAFVRPRTSQLASRRPEVMRVRAVHRPDDAALVYVGYAEDSAGSRLPGLVRSLAKMVADAAAHSLGEPSHFPHARAQQVGVHVFAPSRRRPGRPPRSCSIPGACGPMRWRSSSTV